MPSGHPGPEVTEQSMLDHLLQAVVEDPQAEDRWSISADWLEEHDDPRRAQ
jgi:uncharacterized protein (TIGR02996 family)